MEYRFPPEAPQDYLGYFQDISMRGHAVSSTWSTGVEAATLWVAYHAAVTKNPATLCEIIRVLMPYRWAGTIFHDLWEKAVLAASDFPVREQVSIWRVVFDPNIHGETPVSEVERAQAIISSWEEVADTPAQAADSLIPLFGPSFPLKREWLALARGIDTWLKTQSGQTSFLKEITERFVGSNS